jgi:hypothetical protein
VVVGWSPKLSVDGSAMGRLEGEIVTVSVRVKVYKVDLTGATILRFNLNLLRYNATPDTRPATIKYCQLAESSAAHLRRGQNKYVSGQAAELRRDFNKKRPEKGRNI